MKKAVLAILLASGLCATAQVKRPQILGVAHMAIYVSDLAKARAFYKDFLGYDEVFALKRKNGTDRIAFIKINDRQYLELFAEDPQHNDGQLNHISFYTDDIKGMRDYLAAQGIKVPQGDIPKGQTRNSNYNITDPDGHIVELVQYEPDSWTSREKGKFMPDTRISTHMTHFGVLVGNLDASMKFYAGILGFKEFWRGSPSDRQLSWVNMQVPGGEDYMEFMLYSKPPSPAQRGTKQHICLVVPDIQKAMATLEARPARKDYSRKLEMQTGTNRKRQCNLYDPDGTRVELMEPDTVDGKPVPSSKAPAPPPQKKATELGN